MTKGRHRPAASGPRGGACREDASPGPRRAAPGRAFGPGAACALALALAACGGSDADRLAATVNGERITYADLSRYAAVRKLDEPGASSAPGTEREPLHRLALLRELIDQRLLLQRADQQGLIAADEAVEAAAERYRLGYGGPAAFAEFLAGAGIEPEQFRAELRRQLTVERLLNREVSARVRVAEGEMRAYYDANIAAFAVPEQQLHLAQILVTSEAASPVPNLRNDDATDPEAARRKIQRIHERLEDGEEFGELALHYSEDPIYAATGGDMGFVQQSVLEKADLSLRRAVAALQPGEFSSVLEADGEYRILHLISVEPAGQREFEAPSVQEAIREVLANRKEQLLRLVFYEVERNRAAIRNHLAEEIASEHGIGR